MSEHIPSPTDEDMEDAAYDIVANHGKPTQIYMSPEEWEAFKRDFNPNGLERAVKRLKRIKYAKM